MIDTAEWSANSWSAKSLSSVRLKHAFSPSTISMNRLCLATNAAHVEGAGVGVIAGLGVGVGVTAGLGVGVGVPPNISGGLSAITGTLIHPVIGRTSESISALVHAP